jgi:hypothetical protein
MHITELKKCDGVVRCTPLTPAPMQSTAQSCKSHRSTAALPLAMALAVGFASACRDPMVEQAIAALGPEDPGVATGPLHRPNQPCVLCHSEKGGSSVMSFGGTINRDDLQREAVANATVIIVDATGSEQRGVTNCAGNFFLRPNGTWPQFPVWTSVQVGDYKVDMESPIYRERSCAGCHFDPAGPRSAGHVFLSDDPLAEITLPPNHCGDRP